MFPKILNYANVDISVFNLIGDKVDHRQWEFKCDVFETRAEERRRKTVGSGALTGMLWSLRPLCEEATWARYWMTFFVFSVLPAPDSPLKSYGIESMEINMGSRVEQKCEWFKNVWEEINRLYFCVSFCPLVSLQTNNYNTLCLLSWITDL